MADINQINGGLLNTAQCLLLCSLMTPSVPLLGNSKLGAFALRQRDPRLRALTKDEDVGNPIS